MFTDSSPGFAEIPSDNALLSFRQILPFAKSSELTATYELGPELGRGQFGIIRCCRNRHSNSRFACKSISKSSFPSPRELENIVQEVLIMRKLSDSSSPRPCHTLCEQHLSQPVHATALACGVVRLHDVVEDRGSVHIIMDLCEGGDLYDRIMKKKQYSESQAASLFKSLLETLQFCHDKGIMHRDLKPENILFVDGADNSAVKIADFGLAVEFTSGRTASGSAGSIFYMAPEVLRGEEYSEKIDVWSAGVTLYVMLSGAPPFWEETEQDTIKAIQEGSLTFPPDPWGRISVAAKDLIIQMVCNDSESRCSMAQALKHPWIVQHAKRSRTKTAYSHRGLRSVCR